jgi:hypothetical protein
MAYRDLVKPWFETGDKPTQAQFYQLFDFLRFLDDAISIAQVTGLQDALNSFGAGDNGGELQVFNADASYVLGAGILLEKLIIIPGVNANIKIGSAANLDDVHFEENMSSTGHVIALQIFSLAGRTIFFTGLPANTKIIFFKRLVNLV